MLIQKDYRAIAEIMRKAWKDGRSGTPTSQVLVRVEDDLADYLVADNPRFDRDKFLNACIKE